MPTIQSHSVLNHIRRLAQVAKDDRMTDGQLLERFLAAQDETAFEGLLRRHGPMVLGVCRRLLDNPADAEDAFQATFLVLVRKARSIVGREKVGNWLYGVAYNTARRLRDSHARRRAKERQVESMPQTEMPTQERCDWADVLDEELATLPEKYRLPIVLCDLENRSRKEVAGQLRLAEGTLSSRLARGRILLAKRLSNRGISLSGGALAVALSQSAVGACVPGPLLHSTLNAAIGVAVGQALTQAASAQVAALVKGTNLEMLISKLNKFAVIALVGLLSFGVAVRQHGSVAGEPSVARQSERLPQAKKEPLRKQQPKTATERFRDLVKEYQAALAKYRNESSFSIDKKEEILQRHPRYEFMGRFLELAKNHPKDDAAVDALFWVVNNASPQDPRLVKSWETAVDTLQRSYIQHEKMSLITSSLVNISTDFGKAEKLLETLKASSPHRKVQGAACFALAQLWKRKQAQQLNQKDADKISKAVEHLLEHILKEFADVEHPHGALGKAAAAELFEIRSLSVGNVAPDIDGEDVDGKRLTLSDYRGQVVVLVFSGDWCGPCRALYPQERSLVNRLRGKPFVLLGINSDTNREYYKTVIANEDISWRSWWDGGSARGPIATKWNVNGWPKIYVLDHKGVIRYRDLHGEALDKAVDKLLQELDKDPGAKKKAEAIVRDSAIIGAVQKKVRLHLEPRMRIWAEGSRISSIAFGAEGGLLVTGGWEEAQLKQTPGWKEGSTKGQLRLWSTKSGKELARFGGDFGAVFQAAIAPDGKTIVTAGRTLGTRRGGELRLWDVEKKQLRMILKGHQEWVLTAAFSPDGRYVASGSFDRTVGIWSTATGKEIARLNHPSTPGSLCFSKDGKQLAVGCRRGMVQLWDARTWQKRRAFRADNFFLLSVALSADGKFLAAGGSITGREDGEVRVWNLTTGKERKALRLVSVKACVAFSPDGKALAGAGLPSLVWDAKTGKQLAVIRRDDSWGARSIAFSPDGTTIATTDHPSAVRLWDLRPLRRAAASGGE